MSQPKDYSQIRLEILKVMAWLNEHSVTLQPAEKLQAQLQVRSLLEVYSSLKPDQVLDPELSNIESTIKAWANMGLAGEA